MPIPQAHVRLRSDRYLEGAVIDSTRNNQASAVIDRALSCVGLVEDDHGFSHDALALRLGSEWEQYGRHVALMGRWFFWNGSHWKQDDELQHMTQTREFLRAVAAVHVRTAPADDKEKAEKTAKTLRSAMTVASVISLARSNSEMVATATQWDTDPLLLGGTLTAEVGVTIDLETGAIETPDPLDYITKTTGTYAAPKGARAPMWDAFLKKITNDDIELQLYLQRVAGYCLTGSVKEHVLFFLYGLGANGKSVFVNTLVGIWNDYATTIGTDMLMVSNTDRHPTEVARLRGVRLAVGSEVEVGRTWAESKIKALTGGDRMIGRFMRQDFFEFTPQLKLVVVGNNKPSLRGVDEAIRRRLHLIPFTVTIPPDERDTDLPDKLKDEWPAILRWAVEGCFMWQREGLNPPPVVTNATAEYLAGEDAFERWREECTTEDRNAWETSTALWNSWRAWAQRAGEDVGKQKTFANTLVEHGFVEHRTNASRGYKGARLPKPEPEQEKRYAD